MPRTNIPITNVPLAGVGGALNITLGETGQTSSDETNGNYFVNTSGKIMLLAFNTNAGATRAFTVKSVADSYGRTGDLIITVPISGRYIAGPFAAAAFNQSDGTVNIDIGAGGTTDLKFWVLAPRL
jgi:hypothetical protein